MYAASSSLAYPFPLVSFILASSLFLSSFSPPPHCLHHCLTLKHHYFLSRSFPFPRRQDQRFLVHVITFLVVLPSLDDCIRLKSKVAPVDRLLGMLTCDTVFVGGIGRSLAIGMIAILTRVAQY